jgi:hypothetical protein
MVNGKSVSTFLATHTNAAKPQMFIDIQLVEQAADILAIGFNNIITIMFNKKRNAWLRAWEQLH